MLIWAAVKVPIHVTLNHKHTVLNGSSLSWAWLNAMNSALGGYSTLAVNIADFTVRLIILHETQADLYQR
jgi:cytosine/uracil/thiamine/allantoin permease